MLVTLSYIFTLLVLSFTLASMNQVFKIEQRSAPATNLGCKMNSSGTGWSIAFAIVSLVYLIYLCDRGCSNRGDDGVPLRSQKGYRTVLAILSIVLLFNWIAVWTTALNTTGNVERITIENCDESHGRLSADGKCICDEGYGCEACSERLSKHTECRTGSQRKTKKELFAKELKYATNNSVCHSISEDI